MTSRLRELSAEVRALLRGVDRIRVTPGLPPQIEFEQAALAGRGHAHVNGNRGGDACRDLDRFRDAEGELLVLGRRLSHELGHEPSTEEIAPVTPTTS